MTIKEREHILKIKTNSQKPKKKLKIQVISKNVIEKNVFASPFNLKLNKLFILFSEFFLRFLFLKCYYIFKCKLLLNHIRVVFFSIVWTGVRLVLRSNLSQK